MDSTINYFYYLFDNLDYFSTLLFIFLTILFIGLSIYMVLSQKNVVSERLSRIFPTKKQIEAPKASLIEDEDTGLIAKFTKPLHKIAVPSEKSLKKKIRLKLIQGGFRTESSLKNFMALKIILFVMIPGIYISTKILYSFTSQVLITTLILACIGYLLPDIYLFYHTKLRKQRLLRALPDALDLMVVCVEAGLGLDMTFKKVGEEIRPICRDLSDEFHLTNLEIRAGKARNESFKNMALRTDVPEVHNLLTILIQTSRFGTSIAQALKIHADAVRTKRRQNAELRAAKSTVKLVIPLVMFIFPAIFIVIVGPAAIRIAKILLPSFGG